MWPSTQTNDQQLYPMLIFLFNWGDSEMLPGVDYKLFFMWVYWVLIWIHVEAVAVLGSILIYEFKPDELTINLPKFCRLFVCIIFVHCCANMAVNFQISQRWPIYSNIILRQVGIPIGFHELIFYTVPFTCLCDLQHLI